MQPLSPHQMQIRLLGRLAGPLLAIVHSGMSQVGESQLASLVGAERTTCRTHLRQLEALGYLQRDSRYNGYLVLPIAYQVILGGGPVEKPVDNFEPPIGDDEDPTFEGGNPSFPSPVVGSGIYPLKKYKKNRFPQPTPGASMKKNSPSPPPEFDEDDPRQPEEIEDALDALKGYGIGEPTRSQVLSLSWVTTELIEDWRRALDEAPGPGKWSAGLLIHRLRSGEDPPPSKADRTRQRYSEEAYADFINH